MKRWQVGQTELFSAVEKAQQLPVETQKELEGLLAQLLQQTYQAIMTEMRNEQDRH
jgi:hypothetical protein